MSRVSALIPAAGSGERLGRGPKALLELAGLTLLERAVRALAGIADETVVALPADRLGAPVPPGVRVIPGGSTRQATVARLLDASSGEIVLVHDAARPFLPERVARLVLDAARETGAATATIPVADTLVLDAGGRHGGSVPRERLRAVQTPQGFRRELLLAAHRAAAGTGATDDAGLVALLGHAVALVEGDARLLKLTTPADWALAEAFAPAWDRDPA